MNFIVKSYITIILGITGFSLVQNCFEFELKLYETYLTPYFLSGVVARVVLSLYFVIALFWMFGKASRIIKIATLFLVSLPIYFFVFDVLKDEIIVLSTLFNFSSGLQIPFFLLGFVAVIFAGKNSFSFLPNHLWVPLTKYFCSIGMIVIVFVANPLFLDEFTDESQPFGSAKILESELGEISTDTELRAYFSTSCPYCEMAGKRLMLLKKNYANFPRVKLYFLGTQEGVDWFFEDTKTEFDFEIMETEQFLRITSGSFPKFIHIKNGTPNLLYSGRTFNYLSPNIISQK